MTYHFLSELASISVGQGHRANVRCDLHLSVYILVDILPATSVLSVNSVLLSPSPAAFTADILITYGVYVSEFKKNMKTDINIIINTYCVKLNMVDCLFKTETLRLCCLD